MANEGKEGKKGLDASLENNMSRFRVQKPASADTGPAIPHPRSKDGESGKTDENSAGTNAPDSTQNDGGTTENPTLEVTHIDGPNDEGNLVMALLPPEAVGKRQVNAIKREVDRWDAPKTLGKVEERRYRSAACMARFVAAIDAAAKYNLGRFLIDAKDKLKHGEFIKFLDVGCNLNRRTASKYIQVAKAFPDARTVNLFGFEWCYETASLDIPAEVMDRIVQSESRTQAEEVLGQWEEQQQIAAAWLGLFPNGDPIAVLGRDLALELSRPPFVREFRELVAEKGVDQAKTLIERYQGLLPQFLDGQAVVRTLRGHIEDQAPSGDEASAAPKGVFRLQALQNRFESLTALEGIDMDPEAQSLAKKIEDQLMELTRLLQMKV